MHSHVLAALAVSVLVAACTHEPSGTADGGGGIVLTVPDWEALDVDTVPALGAVGPRLSEDPVPRAVLVVTPPNRPPCVLGADGRWRLVVAPAPPADGRPGYRQQLTLRAPSLDAGGEAMHAIWVSTGDQGLDDLLWHHNGVAVVDSATGDLGAFLQLSDESFEMSSLLGWEDGLPVVGLVDMKAWSASDALPPTYVARWDYRAGTLETIAVVGT